MAKATSQLRIRSHTVELRLPIQTNQISSPAFFNSASPCLIYESQALLPSWLVPAYHASQSYTTTIDKSENFCLSSLHQILRLPDPLVYLINRPCCSTHTPLITFHWWSQKSSLYQWSASNSSSYPLRSEHVQSSQWVLRLANRLCQRQQSLQPCKHQEVAAKRLTSPRTSHAAQIVLPTPFLKMEVQ